MKLQKIPIQQLKEMNSKEFIEITPYIHTNPLVRWVFWKRLNTMINFSKSGERVLDFGAGSGVFVPTLSKNFKEVYCVDIDTRALEFLKEKYKYSNVKVIKSDNGLFNFKNEYFDIIFAADVLEHVKDLNKILQEFKRILKKGGYLIVSGPTENWIYSLARKFVYRRKQDSEHHRNISDIIKETLKLFKIKKRKTIPNPLIPGFKIYLAKKED